MYDFSFACRCVPMAHCSSNLVYWIENVTGGHLLQPLGGCSQGRLTLDLHRGDAECVILKVSCAFTAMMINNCH